MHLLITNPQEIQAYTILRCLRDAADRVVITMGGDSVGSTGFPGMAAYSRFVDARYEVPHFAADWLAGRLTEDNTPLEEAWIQRIEAICRQEKIDVIYPSLDPEVYLLAKNKRRLADQGILTVVADPDVIRIPMDKGLTTRVAERVGFPVPRTWFPANDADVAAIPRESAPPWIVKPRFTAHGANMVFVEDAAALPAAWARVSGAQHLPIIQEYLPGGLRRNYYVTVGRDGEVLSLLSPNVTRTHRSGFKVSSKSAVSASTGPYEAELRALLRELGLWGGYTVQTQIDPRDGRPKLLEINPRFGQHLWWRTGLGVNEPQICLQLARGEQPTGNRHFPDGVLLVDPGHDLILLLDRFIQSAFSLPGRIARRLRGRPAPARGTGASPGFRATLRTLADDYLNGQRKVLCPEVSNLLVDPWPCLRWFWFRLQPRLAYTGRRLGRAVGIGRGKPATAPAQ